MQSTETILFIEFITHKQFQSHPDKTQINQKDKKIRSSKTPQISLKPLTFKHSKMEHQSKFEQARLKEMYSASITRYEEENDYLYKQVTTVNKQNLDLHEKLNQAFTQRSALRQELCHEKLQTAKEVNSAKREARSLREAIEDLKLLVQEKDDSLQEAICTIEELNRRNLSLNNENCFLKQESEIIKSESKVLVEKSEFLEDSCFRARVKSIAESTDSGVSNNSISLFDEIEELQKVGMVRCSTKIDVGPRNVARNSTLRDIKFETTVIKPSLFQRSMGNDCFFADKLNVTGARVEVGWLELCG